jgi:DNA-binding beta-propeller fold protein YncE
MMKLRILIIHAFAALVGLVSCDTKPKADDNIVLPPPVRGSVMMINEGNFQFGNASLTVYDFNHDIIYPDVFEKTNGRKLGDVFQSVTVANGKAYLVVNNSRKIEVIHPETYQSIATITGFTSPRYMLAVSPTKAYVSEYYADAIRVVDLTSNSIIKSIPIQGWMDEMVQLNNKVYVTNAKKDYIVSIDISTDSIVDTIQVVFNSVSLQVDSGNKLWVLSNGDSNKGIRPALQRINPITATVEKTFPLSFAQADVSRLRINKMRSTLYWLSKHVYAHTVSDSAVSSTAFIQSANQNFYGLGVDPFDGEIYVSDAKDFVQQSVINRYRANGTFIGDFKAGLITGGFYFYYP